MNHRIQCVIRNGVDNGIDFDARFQVKGWPAVAVVALGYFAEYPEATEDDPEPELVEDKSRVVVVMVGDDKRHVVDARCLNPLNEGDYCPSCGQIGCGCA